MMFIIFGRPVGELRLWFPSMRTGSVELPAASSRDWHAYGGAQARFGILMSR